MLMSPNIYWRSKTSSTAKEAISRTESDKRQSHILDLFDFQSGDSLSSVVYRYLIGPVYWPIHLALQAADHTQPSIEILVVS
jgi:hypothetical protein